MVITVVQLISAWFLDSELSTCFKVVFYRSYSFLCQSLLLSTTILNDNNCAVLYSQLLNYCIAI